MEILFTRKVVVITGGSSGIGQACVRLFQDGKAKVIILDIFENVDLLSHKDTFFYHCDLSNPDEIKTVFGQIVEKFVQIDVLINNAGVQSRGSVAQLLESDWDRTFNVNLKAVYLCSKHAMDALMRSENPVIVNVASVKSFVCQADEAAYIASKSGVVGLTRSIASDFAPKLRCVSVSPGAVYTPLLTTDFNNHPQPDNIIRETEAIHLLNRIAQPDEIANVIYFLASAKASFITGHDYRVDGGIGIKIQGT